jgi:hypothetical protein
MALLLRLVRTAEEMDKKNLPGFDFVSAFDGALRFHDEKDFAWVFTWGRAYAELAPTLRMFASDAFGVFFGVHDNDTVAIFWPETGQVESLGLRREEFYEQLAADPDLAIGLQIYRQAVQLLGRPQLDQHFAMVIETALGGRFTADNLRIVNAADHMVTLAGLAHQLRFARADTRMTIPRREGL